MNLSYLRRFPALSSIHYFATSFRIDCPAFFRKNPDISLLQVYRIVFSIDMKNQQNLHHTIDAKIFMLLYIIRLFSPDFKFNFLIDRPETAASKIKNSGLYKNRPLRMNTVQQ
jgi:hypothetical protein